MKTRYVIVVYAAATVDEVGGSTRPGGPGFYASLALRATGLTGYVAVKHALGGCTARFIHREEDGRRLSVLASPPRCRGPVAAEPGDAALVSPVACELGIEDLARLTAMYPIGVADVQGYMRTCSKGPVSQTRFSLAAAMPPPRRGWIVKASIEDLGWDTVAASDLLEREGSAVTFGDRGVAAFLPGRGCIICETRRIDTADTVGAGDALATLALAARLLYGEDWARALCRAAAATACFLENRDRLHEAPCRRVFAEEPPRPRLLPRCCDGLALVLPLRA